MRRRTTAAALGLFLGQFGAGPLVRAAPPPERGEEPPPLARAPELLRRPVELVGRATATLSSCVGGAGEARCEALGPGLGGELSALYRPTPYFAFGGAAGYARAAGGFPGGTVAGEALSLGMLGRVYLLEEGPLDPYLEALVGWGSERTTFTAAGGVGGPARQEDAAYGPFGRAGGGVDWLCGPGVKVGLSAAYGQLLVARGETCGQGRCFTGGAPSGSVRGGVAVGLGLSLLLGQAL